MNAKRMREFYQEYLEVVYHQGQLDQLDQFYSENVVVHGGPLGSAGLEGLKQGVSLFTASFSDWQLTVDLFAYDHESSVIATRVIMKMVHTGDFMGVPATGRTVAFAAHSYYRVQDGKFVELWDLTDMLSLLQQVGVIPSPGQA